MQIDPIDPRQAEAATAEQARRDRRRREVERSELKRLLSGELARAVFARIFDFVGIHRSTYVPGDERHSTFLQGQQNVGLWLLKEIMEVCPELWDTMRNERALRLAREAIEDKE